MSVEKIIHTYWSRIPISGNIPIYLNFTPEGERKPAWLPDCPLYDIRGEEGNDLFYECLFVDSLYILLLIILPSTELLLLTFLKVKHVELLNENTSEIRINIFKKSYSEIIKV